MDAALHGTHAPAAELDVREAALRALFEGRVPFLVAGTYAWFEYTGIARDTKDLDLFLRRRDLPAAFDALRRAGFETEEKEPLWLAKAYRGSAFVDLIHSSGNGVAVIDDGWFEHARRGEVLGVPVLLAPPEEMIWSKSFVCERERYDGHDVAQLVRACGDRLDWERLLARFGPHWEVLLSHLVMYRFAYPSERSKVPAWVMAELLARAGEGLREGDWERRVCRGTLVSRFQYQHALDDGYEDGRGEAVADACREHEGRGEEGRTDAERVPPGGGGRPALP